jgi:hypothetical protein
MDNIAMYGFRPYKGAGGMAAAMRTFRIPVASAYSSAVPVGTAGIGFRAGDPINQVTDGTAQQLVVSDGTPTETTMKCLGVVVGIDPWFDSTIGQTGAMRRADNLPSPAPTYGTNFDRQSNILYVPAEGTVFEVDATGTLPTTYAGYLALVGANVPLIYSAVAPKAFPRIDVTTPVTTAEQVRIVGVSPTMMNQDFSGLNVKLLVQFNLVQNAPANTTGV